MHGKHALAGIHSSINNKNDVAGIWGCVSTLEITAARGPGSPGGAAINTMSTSRGRQRPRTGTVAAEVTWFRQNVCVGPDMGKCMQVHSCERLCMCARACVHQCISSHVWPGSPDAAIREYGIFIGVMCI